MRHAETLLPLLIGDFDKCQINPVVGASQMPRHIHRQMLFVTSSKVASTEWISSCREEPQPLMKAQRKKAIVWSSWMCLFCRRSSRALFRPQAMINWRRLRVRNISQSQAAQRTAVLHLHTPFNGTRLELHLQRLREFPFVTSHLGGSASGGYSCEIRHFCERDSGSPYNGAIVLCQTTRNSIIKRFIT